MTNLRTIVEHFDALLESAMYKDAALNGLQVEGAETVRKAAFAVDAGLSVIEKAIAENCNLLVVHHGLYWDHVLPCTGIHGKKLALLLKNGCSLYASHLPLDGNHEAGNGFEFARYLGLESLKGFCEYGGMHIGCAGSLRQPASLEYFTEKCKGLPGAHAPLALPFGTDKIRSVAIVTGSGAFALPLCKKESIDLFISGEPKHQIYHECKELKQNALFVGHYVSETFGVRALMERIKKKFELDAIFIDEPSRI